ncbi:tRNA pseudouridine(55) synthase TruB [Blattabacterium sp. (Cryptocercus punctulatus) str. Cpu]|uniref:tRNA pseudouridine(55) synthase TruB n=1 Tax=Blattabacterium sp. (Cryptocercus punctulatus) str. Cpu TaxID=1075399 RepID=UPI0002387109|nr:tRNA-pseudouridine synthase I [Blattabacterium sp. (Cryptocercus punctulatus) str. Cpu]
MIKNCSEFEKGKLLLIDKPWGWTSFEVVKRIKQKIICFSKRIKIGHAGTLDPLATGLLIILTGKYTKKVDSIQNYKKTYTGIIKMGCVTPSFDSETKEYNFSSTSHITPELIQKISKKFIGEINQYPPCFSALKIEGKRFYEYARKGKKIKNMKPRRVRIYQFHILKIGIPYIKFLIECGKGTYIRSIAQDFGIKIKSGAYLLSLRRERIGPFSIKNSSKEL